MRRDAWCRGRGLLSFKRTADPPDDGLSGEEAYRRYAEKMVALVQSKGGRVIWSGRVDSQVLGSGAELFTMASLVEYPSRRAFVEIASDPYVQEIGIHRAAGLRGPVAARHDADADLTARWQGYRVV